MDPPNTEKHEIKRARKLVWKNLIVIGLSWIFLFTAFTSIANLQSSLNTDKGLGTVSLSIIYIAMIFSSLFLPSILIEKLTVKWTIFFAQLTYIIYIAANIYPRYYTLVPGAIILGPAPLWTAQSTFLNDLGTFYSKFTNETSEAVINRLFGIFFAMFQTSNIWGNIAVSTILKPEPEKNTTFVTNMSLCGSNDCPGNGNGHFEKPNMSTVYILCGIFIGLSLIGVLLIFFLLDTYKKIGLTSPESKTKSIFSLLICTLKHMKNLNQILIIPLSFWAGVELAFFTADFTKSFVSCLKGVEFIGYIMICYGVTDTLASYLFGFAIKYVGRIPCFCLAAVINYASIFLMIFWKPTAENNYIIFIISILWGICDAVWNTPIIAFYGVIFKENQEAAFSNFKLWQSLGLAIPYAYSMFLCTNVKLYLLLVFLTIGMIGYGILEYRLRVVSTKL